MTPLQELTKKIQAHCPELVELSFGCVVKRTKYGKPSFGHVISCGGSRTEIIRLGMIAWEGNRVAKIEIVDAFEILGHPITLEHVLRAIAKSGRGDIKYRGVYNSLNYTFMALGEGTIETGSNHHYDLNKPLHLQSEPLINWLNTIIK